VINVELQGTTSLKMDAIEFEAKDSAPVLIQGAVAEFSDDAPVKFSSGAITDISGGLMAIVSGRVVMIN
jgi:hypothetical protein